MLAIKTAAVYFVASNFCAEALKQRGRWTLAWEREPNLPSMVVEPGCILTIILVYLGLCYVLAEFTAV